GLLGIKASPGLERVPYLACSLSRNMRKGRSPIQGFIVLVALVTLFHEDHAVHARVYPREEVSDQVVRLLVAVEPVGEATAHLSDGRRKLGSNNTLAGPTFTNQQNHPLRAHASKHPRQLKNIVTIHPHA